MLIWKCR